MKSAIVLQFCFVAEPQLDGDVLVKLYCAPWASSLAEYLALREADTSFDSERIDRMSRQS
ncbi:hypothetical protein NKJ40_00515 [Mesorhizobium sp. M0119]|uniref:hypothetical protein n=1 Tax=unclassified Mesorhizobium TaxID=325217 RepID=UPI00333AB80C